MSINRVAYREYRQNLLFNVSVIGWLGNLSSSATLLCSALTILHSNAVIAIILELMNMCDGPGKVQMQNFLENFILCTATVCYILSLGNILVSTMLLIGTARKSCSFMFPWLIYQGLLFGIGVHMILYLALSNLFIDFTVFVFCSLIFTMAMIIYVKIYMEVFMLFKLLKEEYNDRQQNLNIIPPEPAQEAMELHNRVSHV